MFVLTSDCKLYREKRTRHCLHTELHYFPTQRTIKRGEFQALAHFLYCEVIYIYVSLIVIDSFRNTSVGNIKNAEDPFAFSLLEIQQVS